jgi:CheY-like chemotaxis protein
LSFSREDEQDQKPIQISHLLKETVHFLRATLPATIGIRREIQKAGMIMADPSRIRQMVINLCTNAAESMRADGGRLEIRLENVELQKPLPAVNALLPACGYVRITVRDSGHGMTGEVQQRIFQPFFTTRREGSGLGLSVVQSILEAHGGGITVESKTGAGSCFRVYLPRIDTPVEKIETGDRRFEPRGQGERILFVDDEPSLVEVGRETLSQLGYTPDCHTDSREALRRFQSAPEVFDLVVTDLTMPELTGLELTEAIRGLRPDIPVILCTGLGDFMTEELSAGSGIRYFLQKPLTRRDLASGIEKALTEKA